MHHRWLAAAYAAALAALLTGVSGCGPRVQAAGAHPPAAGPADPLQAARLHQYQAEVLPIFQAKCLRCHGGMNRRGGLNMSTRANLMQGGKDGAVVIAGRPEDSLMVRVINPKLPEDDPMRMPPKGDRLSDAEVAAIRKWIADGAVMDR